VSSANARVVGEALEALGSEDPAGFVARVDPEIEIETARGVRRGREAALEWASKRYDHLVRRWAIDELREDGDRILMIGRVQYVWRDDGVLGAESPIALELELDGGLLRRLRIRESVAEALAAHSAMVGGRGD
jgi:hypothetical protein